MNDSRAEFEALVSAPPFERSTARYPNDPKRFAWPGSYVDPAVNLAWHAWQAARGETEGSK